MTDYTAWMIELYETPDHPGARGFCGWWRGADFGSFGWTEDPNEAIKFLTRVDAERAAVAFGLTSPDLHRVTELAWPSRE